MNTSLAALLALALIGCAIPPERLNPGAERGVYFAAPSYLAKLHGRPVAGVYVRATGDIYLSRELPPWHLAMTAQHELAHALLAAPREDPRTILRLYHSDAYPVCESDNYPPPTFIQGPRYVGPAQDH